MDWNFRPLKPGETRILFERHGAHKDNVLTSIDLCEKTGATLKEAGIEIHGAWSSPAPRALATAYHTLVGFGKMVPQIRTDDRLADMAINPAGTAAVEDAKTTIKRAGVPVDDPGLAQVLFGSDRFADLMTRRGEEGADFLREIALKNPGKNILAASHGVARIENTLMVLRYKELYPPDRLVATCQIVEIILDSGTGELVEENWLEPVTV